MIKMQPDMGSVHTENSGNIAGTIDKQFIFTPPEMFDMAKMFAKITLKPGSMIKEHAHTDDAEVYYLLQGEAVVTDGGVQRVLRAGDAVFTGHGNTHSIGNKTEEDVVFLAVILK